MPFWKNHKRDKKDSPENEKSLNPVLHVMGSLKDYHTEMVQKEVDTLGELNNIGNSFNTVLADSEDFQEKLQDFGHNFSTIEQVWKNCRILAIIFPPSSRCPANSEQ